MAGRDASWLAGTLRQHGQTDPYGRALKSLRPWIGLVALFSALLNVLMLTGSIYMLQIYDRVLASGSVPTLVGLFAIVVVLYGFLGVYDFLRARMLSRAGLRLDAAMALPAFQAWLRAGSTTEQGQPTPGPDPNRTLRDVETIRAFASSPAAAVLFDLPFVPFFIAVLFLLHPWLGWATVLGAGLAATVALTGRWLTERGLAEAAPREAAPRALAEAGRRSAETVLAMGMDRALGDRWHRLHEEGLAAGQGTTQMNEGLTAGSRAFRMFLQSAILTLGAYLTLRGDITAGMIIAGSILSGRALAPIDQAVGQARMLGRARDAHLRLRAFSAAMPAPARTVTLPPPEGRLEVSDLTRLAPALPGTRERRRILTDIRFRLEPGDALGVIGPSASGKSTLARLLAGAQQPDGGKVRLGGAALSQYQQNQLQAHVGYLPQRVDLLPGSIRDNIARFQPDARDDAVITAARAAGVHEMILALPDGYNTEIGGGQDLLSGGQVQRIGLARALFGTPALVVLDEPNAHLDTAGDKALTQAVEQLRSSGAAIVIMAHRPGALAAVNKLMLLEGGRMSAFGDKSEVLNLVAGPNMPAAGAMTPRSADGSIRFRKPGVPAGPVAAHGSKGTPKAIARPTRDSTAAEPGADRPARTRPPLAERADARPAGAKQAGIKKAGLKRRRSGPTQPLATAQTPEPPKPTPESLPAPRPDEPARAKAAPRSVENAKTAGARPEGEGANTTPRPEPHPDRAVQTRHTPLKRTDAVQTSGDLDRGERPQPSPARPEPAPPAPPMPFPKMQHAATLPARPDSLPDTPQDQPPARVRAKLSRRQSTAMTKGSPR